MLDDDAIHGVSTDQERQDDLSIRADYFRQKLIEEFHLDENVSLGGPMDPRYSTCELFSADGQVDSTTVIELLKNHPEQPVRFKIFKRAQDNPHSPEQQRDALDKRLARVTNMHGIPVSVWAHWISKNKYFNGVVFLLILANAVMQGVQTEMSRENNPSAYDVMETFDDITIVVFSIEILVKWLDSFGGFWYDGWNIFDFIVTILSAVPRLMSIFLDTDTSFANISSQLKLFRTLRILKMIARMSSLRVVISTVIEAFRSLGYILLLLLLLSYIFGIFAINLFQPYTDSTDPGLKYQDKFADLPKTFVTLFQLLTLDQWYEIHKDIRLVVNAWIVITFFICWVWIGAFIFRNVFVGVMVRKFDQMSSALRHMVKKDLKAKRRNRQLGALQQKLNRQKSSFIIPRAMTGISAATGLLSPQGAMSSKAPGSPRSAYTDGMEKDSEFMPDAAQDLASWNATVQNTLQALKHQEPVQYMWHRNDLFTYLRVMEKLQNNAKEHQQLQHLAAAALHQLYE